MPSATRLTVGIMGLVAEEERRLIGTRIKEALAAAKAHGTRLGDDRGYRPTQDASGSASSVVKAQADARARDVLASIKALQDSGSVSLRAIAAGLNSQGIPTARGGTWSATQVMNVLKRASAIFY